MHLDGEWKFRPAVKRIHHLCAPFRLGVIDRVPRMRYGVGGVGVIVEVVLGLGCWRWWRWGC